jgi:CheY-like chemotaxis protein
MGRPCRLCWQIAGLIRVPAARQVAQQADIGGLETGIDSLSLAGLAPPDPILLDLHLADLPGEQVLNALKASRATAGIPVVVLSAEADRAVIRRLLANGATAYLTKPLNLAELGGLVDSLAPASTDRRSQAADAPGQPAVNRAKA